MPEREQGTITDHPDDVSEAGYLPYSGLAIASLLLSVVSLLAFWHPFLWVAPVIAVAVGLLAIARIDGRPNELLGRGLAVFAICLALVSLASASSRYALLNYRARAAAREMGFLWFQALRDGNPELAAQLTREPARRVMSEEDLATFFRGEPGASEFLAKFVSNPVVKALLKLGPGARVRYIETQAHLDDRGRERIYAIYAVTYEDAGEVKSFFVQLALIRYMASPRQPDQWWVSQSTLVERPLDFLKQAD